MTSPALIDPTEYEHILTSGYTKDDHFGALETSRGHLPLRAMDVQMKASGLTAEVSLMQTFVNTYEVPLEATYTFPLPSRAAVTRFQMKLSSRIIEGSLERRGVAREMYNQAIAKGHRAAIAEEERPDIFTMRVGNIPPGEEAAVRLTMSVPLVYDNGDVSWRFPLVVPMKYIPGKPLPGQSVGSGTATDTDAVPDASRITPPRLVQGYPNPISLSISMEITGEDAPIRDFASSLPVTVEENQPGSVWVQLDPGARLDRDFVLRWKLGDEAVCSSLTLNDDSNGQEGTLALTFVPPVDMMQSVRPRDVVFVLDRSGSMSGWRMVAARRALASMIDTLASSDRFNVIAFDNVQERPPFMQSGLHAATWLRRTQTIRWIETINARGGTEMAQPLKRSLAVLNEDQHPQHSERDRCVIVVTDGEVGNERQILAHIRRSIKDCRIHTVGIGGAVSEGFLQRLASQSGGHCELVQSQDMFDEAMDRVHRFVDTPVLTQLGFKLQGATLIPSTITPKRTPDLFAGAPVTIFARYKKRQKHCQAVVHAQGYEGDPWTTTITGKTSTQRSVTHLWARQRIRDLDDIVAGQNARHLERDIEEISLRFGVLSRLTAFVAVDRAETIDAPKDSLHKVTQAVETPEDSSFGGNAGPNRTDAFESFSKMESDDHDLATACLDFNSLGSSTSTGSGPALQSFAPSAFAQPSAPVARTLSSPLPRPASHSAPAPMAPIAPTPQASMAPPSPTLAGGYSGQGHYGESFEMRSPMLPPPSAMSMQPPQPHSNASFAPPSRRKSRKNVFLILVALLFGLIALAVVLYFALFAA